MTEPAPPAAPGAAAAPAPVPAEAPASSLGRDAWRRLWANRRAAGGLVFLLAMVLLCGLGPLFSPYEYAGQDWARAAEGPSLDHWLGTDTLGRDLLTRILHGGRISLGVGFLATAVALVIGVLYGGVSGYAGGRVDALLMRLVDLLYALPFTVLVILLMVVFGRSLWLVFLAIGAVEWLTMARLVRGQVLALKRQEFVEAAVALGLSPGRILLRHLLPNVLGPVTVYATLTVPAVILLESMLSFLGLGVPPPQASWGVLISEGKNAMTVQPWLLVCPALFFSLTLLALNFLGDGLRDALDPRDARA